MSKVVSPQTYYIYTLAYPDGKVFYVGKGTNGRIADHEREASKGCNCPKCDIIREIWADNKPVQKRIVFETLNETEALTYELDLIKQSGEPSLVNVRGNREKNKVSYNPQKDHSPKSPSIIRKIKAELREKVIGVRAAAYLLGVDSKTVIRLIQRGKIPGFQVGNVWKVHREDIENYIQDQMERAKE